jgi:hypothetical protein
MTKMIIPEEVKKEVLKIIEGYNKTVYGHLNSVKYLAEFKGNTFYLKRKEIFGDIFPIARLTYTGKMDKWKFAIYKWTSDSYDPDEWFFPGYEFVDGTILGALKAGDEAYPIDY